jgi:prepilin-type N-terminal cleavage/methylation domain-containing protein
MSLNNIKTMKRDRGFTLVELLIVIVVIAILAAITIVAYNGIQTRANVSTAKSNAESVQKIAEAYAADDSASGGNGKYPSAISDITTWSAASTSVSRLPSGVSLIATILSTAQKNGKTIQYVPLGTTGACIGYWDDSTGLAGYVYAGNAKTGGNATPPTCS